MNARTIVFEGKEYPAREVKIGDYGNVIVSVVSLNNMLIDQLCVPVSDEAEEIDDGIFFYVEDNEIDLPDEEIEKIVLENI